MSPSQRLAIAHRIVGQALHEVCVMDNELSAVDAAALLGGACYAVIASVKGNEVAAEAHYRHADALIGGVE